MMAFARTEEQRLLAGTIARSMADDDRRSWADAQALGLDLLGRAEADGGLGTDLRDAAVVAEALGRVNAGIEFADHWCAASGGDDDRLALLHCAELTGLSRTMLHDAGVFMVERRQFGVAIASFQALRHRMADMAMWLEQASAITDGAIDAVEDVQAVCAARVLVEDAARAVGEGAVQIHGAMGLTAELRIGGFFRRARALMQRDGGARAWLSRYAAAASQAGQASNRRSG